MSHVKLIEPEREYTLDALKGMCELLGWKMRESKTWRWFMRWVGDTPLPKELVVKDLDEVDYEIQVPGARYSIGVKIKKGKIHLLYDFWQGGYGLEKAMGGPSLGILKQHYNMAESFIAAKKQRRRVREVESPHKRARRLVVEL